MNELITFAVGLGVGLLFGILRLPIPAPPTIAGVLGIVGIFVGFIVIQKIIG